MSDILLATKIHVPPLRSHLVNRPYLIQRLNDGMVQNRRLTLISAPAGYGKSTLLSEWIAQLHGETAWLSLEKGENSPTRFWTYFITALHTIPSLRQAGIGQSILQALQSRQPPAAMEGLLSSLLNDLSRLAEDAVLVLDDLHAITERKIHQDLVFLIEHLPRSVNGLHLVVASRMDPPWPLARWRARDDLIELRTSDLRFSYEEVFRFLKQTLQVKLSSHEITALQQRTEGWVAGLQMAAVSMQGQWLSHGAEGVSRFIETFTSSNRFILDYLVEEVINLQPIEIQNFLYDTSVLEQLTASLCNNLTDRQDSQEILEQLEQANLFLIPLDDERRWYRYHHLFAELLRKRLRQTQPDRIIEMNQRASQWYARNNFLSEAIDHALDAGDVLLVNNLVSGNALAMIEHAELLDVLRHFEDMPEEQISPKPWLCVAYAWTKAYADPSGDVGRILQQAEQDLTGVESAMERKHLISHLAAIRAYVAWVKGRADEALVLARNALENLPEDEWIARSHILNIEGLALQYNFELDGAVQSFKAAAAAGKRTGRSYETFHAYTNLAYANLLQGKLNQTASTCRHVLYLADQAGQVSLKMPVLAYAYATLSLVQVERNEVGPAVSNARQSVALAEQWNQADTLHFTLTCLSKALCVAGELEEAFLVNQRSMQLAMNTSPWFFRISAFDEIWINLLRGDILAATRRFAEIDSLAEKKDRESKLLNTEVFLLYTQKRFSAAKKAAEDASVVMKRWGANWEILNLLPFQALVLQALGREEEAMKVIDECLAMAAPEGFVRVFIERGVPMVKLLQQALKRGIETEYINKLLLAFNLPTSQQRSVAPVSSKTRPIVETADLFEPLSERELQVLSLLDSPLTSEEIGQELYVSVNTIRTHIRNIYAKMGVNRRRDAVSKAKELKLM